MELKIHTRNVDMNARLQEHVERKVNKLDRYLPNIQSGANRAQISALLNSRFVIRAV
jgi:ribosome-associated translation inhibitor RaiA